MKLKKVKKLSEKRANSVPHPGSEKAKEKSPDTQDAVNTVGDHERDYGGLPAIDLKKNLGCG